MVRNKLFIILFLCTFTINASWLNIFKNKVIQNPKKTLALLTGGMLAGYYVYDYIAFMKRIKDIAQNQSNNDFCTICQSNIMLNWDSNKEGNWAMLPCNHLFHKECLGPWMVNNDICPNCRERFWNLDVLDSLNYNGLNKDLKILGILLKDKKNILKDFQKIRAMALISLGWSSLAATSALFNRMSFKENIKFSSYNYVYMFGRILMLSRSNEGNIRIPNMLFLNRNSLKEWSYLTFGWILLKMPYFSRINPA